MTPEQIDEIERLEKAATPGPWESTHSEIPSVGTSSFIVRKSTPHRQVGRVSALDEAGVADARLIAAVRNNLPALLAAARENAQCVCRPLTAAEVDETLRAHGVDADAAWARFKPRFDTFDKMMTERDAALARAEAAEKEREEAVNELRAIHGATSHDLRDGVAGCYPNCAACIAQAFLAKLDGKETGR